MGDELLAPAPGSPDLREPDGVACDLEPDFGPGVQAELLPDPQRNRDLAFGRDSHRAPPVGLLPFLLLHERERVVKGGIGCSLRERAAALQEVAASLSDREE